MAGVSGELLENSDVPTSLGHWPTVGLTRVHFLPPRVSTTVGEAGTLSDCVLSLSLTHPAQLAHASPMAGSQISMIYGQHAPLGGGKDMVPLLVQ